MGQKTCNDCGAPLGPSDHYCPPEVPGDYLSPADVGRLCDEARRALLRQRQAGNLTTEKYDAAWGVLVMLETRMLEFGRNRRDGVVKP